MKTKPDTIEDVFAPAKQSGLTASERTDMWGELKAYAEYHQPAEVIKKKSPYFNPRYFVSALATVVVFVGTGFAAEQSLPGEPLYVVKVEVLEPFNALTATSEEDKLAYHITQLERRLSEVKELEQQGNTESESMALASTYVNSHVEDIITLVGESDNEEISQAQVLTKLTEATGVIRAHDSVEDEVNKNHVSMTDEVLQDLDVAFEKEAAAFAKENPADALSYIETIVGEVDDVLTASSTEEQKNQIHEDLEAVADSLRLGDLTNALTSVSDIKEDTVFEEYSE